MFCVYVSRSRGRVLVTSEELREDGWELVVVCATWREAYRRGLQLAEKFDYLLEWYYEDQARAARRLAGIARTPTQ